ncbi:MAG TPA: EamA family transporter [Coleofasciculaceae cyanobacterium]
MTLQDFGILFFSILTSITGQFFLKTGALKLGKVNPINFITYIKDVITTSELLIGLTFYAIGALAYILLLTRVSLSVASPSGALVYVLSALLGYFVFKESLPVNKLVGISLIISGVLLLAWKK